jgi:hypothetical protein
MRHSALPALAAAASLLALAACQNSSALPGASAVQPATPGFSSGTPPNGVTTLTTPGALSGASAIQSGAPGSVNSSMGVTPTPGALSGASAIQQGQPGSVNNAATGVPKP